MVDKGGTIYMHLTELQAWNFFHIFFQAWEAKAEVFLLPLASANPRGSPGCFSFVYLVCNAGVPSI